MTEKIYAGTIIKWHSERGFGFVHSNSNDRNYFMHIRAWTHADFPPTIGQHVAFELGPDDRDREKLKAIKVRVIAVAAGLEALQAGV